MALMDTKEHVNDDIIDITLPVKPKKSFRIDGDNNRILELDTSDINVITRMETALPKLNKLASEASKELTEDVTDEDSDVSLMKGTSETLKKIDADMRDLIDEIFDSNVSEMCAPVANLYSPYNGKFLFEHIIETIGNLYTENISKEFEKISDRVNKHTKKYVRK